MKVHYLIESSGKYCSFEDSEFMSSGDELLPLVLLLNIENDVIYIEFDDKKHAQITGVPCRSSCFGFELFPKEGGSFYKVFRKGEFESIFSLVEDYFANPKKHGFEFEEI